MLRLVHITTVPDSLGFIEGQIGFMQNHGFDVSVITSPGEKADAFVARTGVRIDHVTMSRAMTPRRDVESLALLTSRLLELDPDIVHAHTPKAGMLGMIAATAALVPVRLYHMRGLLTFTSHGWKKQLFRNAERTSCGLAHHVIAQSKSLRQHAIDDRLVDPDKISVLGGGSNGVDARGRFDPDRTFDDVISALGIPAGAKVVGFVGRLVRDKGIGELVTAWRAVQTEQPTAHLVLVGPFEERDALSPEVVEELQANPTIHWVPFTRETPSYYNAFDVVVLPSYREGFPNVPLEAAAMKIPVICTNVPGCIDAVVDGKTGVIVPVKSSEPLANAIVRYLEDPALRKEHGDAGRNRVLEQFDPKSIWHQNLDLYQRLLERHAYCG